MSYSNCFLNLASICFGRKNRFFLNYSSANPSFKHIMDFVACRRMEGRKRDRRRLLQEPFFLFISRYFFGKRHEAFFMALFQVFLRTIIVASSNLMLNYLSCNSTLIYVLISTRFNLYISNQVHLCCLDMLFGLYEVSDSREGKNLDSLMILSCQ